VQQQQFHHGRISVQRGSGQGCACTPRGFLIAIESPSQCCDTIYSANW
jgi:hypothetical protein